MLYDHDQVLIFPQRKEGFRLLQRLAIPIESILLIGWAPQMRTLESTIVPMLAIGDINGDKRLDISYYRNEAIGIFPDFGGTIMSCWSVRSCFPPFTISPDWM